MADAKHYVQTGISILVLIFTLPVFGSIFSDIQADPNITGTTELIVGFIFTIYTLGILVVAADGLLGGAISQRIRGR